MTNKIGLFVGLLLIVIAIALSLFPDESIQVNKCYRSEAGVYAYVISKGFRTIEFLDINVDNKTVVQTVIPNDIFENTFTKELDCEIVNLAYKIVSRREL